LIFRPDVPRARVTLTGPTRQDRRQLGRQQPTGRRHPLPRRHATPARPLPPARGSSPPP